MQFDDSDMIMISALQHYMFCPRQCALIHLEQQWSENYFTAIGKIFHERVDKRLSQTSGNLHTASGLRLFSRRLGATGIADMVEFHRCERETDESGVRVAVKLKGLADCWRPCPVEYKSGKAKADNSDKVQLCAQAICIEEMLDVSIGEGALFYGKIRRRNAVAFTDDLRAETLRTAQAVHNMLALGETPEGVYSKSCTACSMLEICRPLPGREASVKAWLDREIGALRI